MTFRLLMGEEKIRKTVMLTEKAHFSEPCMTDMRPAAKNIAVLKQKRPYSKMSFVTVDFLTVPS